MSRRYANKALVARAARLEEFQGPNTSLSSSPAESGRPKDTARDTLSVLNRAQSHMRCTRSSRTSHCGHSGVVDWFILKRKEVSRVGDIQPHTLQYCFVMLGYSRWHTEITMRVDRVEGRVMMGCVCPNRPLYAPCHTGCKC